jgi:hypothetical protein
MGHVTTRLTPVGQSIPNTSPGWLFDPSNAYWMVSVNHDSTPAAFREPPLQININFSSRRQFKAHVFSMNSGYRTQ